LTSAVVRRLGLGGTLAVTPVCIAGCSTAMMAMPGLGPAMAGELVDSATRYTITRTAMELLYLPHPADVRNRVKTFVDVFVDRMSRGIGGILLAALLSMGIRDRRQIGALILCICILWAYLCVLAQREYVRTVRDRVVRRRLELDSSRVNVSDPAMIAMLVEAAEGSQARPVCYALNMLAEAPDFDLHPLLRKLAASPHAEVRARVYEVAWFVRFEELEEQALAEIRRAAPADTGPALRPAVEYALSFARDETGLAQELIGHPNQTIAAAAVHILALHPVTAREVLTPAWILNAVVDLAPKRRRLAAMAIASVRGGAHNCWLHALLRDSDAPVARAACHAASVVGHKSFLPVVIGLLANARVRHDAAEALTMYGAVGLDMLAGMLDDNEIALSLRRQIPRVLGRISNQKSVDILTRFLGHPDLAIRGAVVDALGRLRKKSPDLDYSGEAIAQQVLAEARYYFELHAILAPLTETKAQFRATTLLIRTLEHRAAQAVERLFGLLGLRYPQSDVHAAYSSLRGRRREEATAALEMLENMLEHSLRRVVVPLMDLPSSVVEKGRELFRIEVGTTESALRELLQTGDTWLVACAAASAAEQGMHSLAAEIQAGAEKDPAEVGPVARSALAALAATSC
jgi:AAA family ATP:ADP antiporter